MKKLVLVTAALLLASTSLWADSISQTASKDFWKINSDMNANGFAGFKNSLAVADFKAGNNDYTAGLVAAFFGNWKVANADFQNAINDWNDAAVAMGDSGLPGATAVPEPEMWILLALAGLTLAGSMRVRFAPSKVAA